jgi:hypothetical protein
MNKTKKTKKARKKNKRYPRLVGKVRAKASKYIAEDSRPGAFSPSGADAASLQAEAEAIMRSPEYQDFRSPGYEAARAKVQELFGQVAKARK